jgi:hypothetical protein
MLVLVLGSPTVFQNFRIVRLKATIFQTRGSRCKIGFSYMVDFATNRWTVQQTATTYWKTTLFRRTVPLTVKRKNNFAGPGKSGAEFLLDL